MKYLESMKDTEKGISVSISDMLYVAKLTKLRSKKYRHIKKRFKLILIASIKEITKDLEELNVE